MATTLPARRSRHRSSAAAERVVPFLAASAAVRGSLSVQITSFFAGSRARVTPCATISASQKIGAPLDKAPRAAADQVAAEDDVLRHVDLAAGMDHAHRDVGFFRREARQIGFGADDRKGALIDRACRRADSWRSSLRHARPPQCVRAHGPSSRRGVRSRHDRKWRVAHGPIGDQRAALGRADDGERRSRRNARSPWRSRKYESCRERGAALTR